MPNQRDRSKKLVGFFATDEEKRLIQKAEKAHKMTVAGFIRAIATGELKVSPHIKTIALSMMGAQQSMSKR